MNFIFQSRVCDGCHDMAQKSMSFDDVAIVTVKGNDYRICNETVDLNEKIRQL